jgi:hypothetical protein
MSSNAERLNIWREIAKTPLLEELAEVTAGRNAEKSLQSMFDAKLFFKQSCIFHSKRVPYQLENRRGRYEIDLIVLTQKQICAIEIKNWSGSVRRDGNHWVQTKKNGTEVVHDDPIEKNRKKLDVLCDYLEKRKCPLPNARVSKVIQWNSNINVHPNIGNNPDLIRHFQLEKFLKSQKGSSFGERLLHSVLSLCLDQEKSKVALDGFFSAIPEEDYLYCSNLIDDLHNFDQIEMFGGRVISGDLLKLNLSEKSIPLNQLSKGQKVEVLCVRAKLLLFFIAFLGNRSLFRLGSPFEEVTAHPWDNILFHAAGDPKPKQIQLAQIKSFQRG